MNPTQRWTVAGIIALIIALLWLFWPRPEQKPVPDKAPAVAQPPAVTPVATARTEGPLTVTALFDYNSADLRPGETAKLDELAGRAKASGRVQAVGHADRIGSNEYNMELSRRRAEAVRSHLLGKGIESARVRAEGRGEKEAATGAACRNMGTESRGNSKLVECLQRDRRVEITLASN